MGDKVKRHQLPPSDKKKGPCPLEQIKAVSLEVLNGSGISVKRVFGQGARAKGDFGVLITDGDAETVIPVSKKGNFEAQIRKKLPEAKKALSKFTSNEYALH